MIYDSGIQPWLCVEESQISNWIPTNLSLWHVYNRLCCILITYNKNKFAKLSEKKSHIKAVDLWLYTHLYQKRYPSPTVFTLIWLNIIIPYSIWLMQAKEKMSCSTKRETILLKAAKILYFLVRYSIRTWRLLPSLWEGQLKIILRNNTI